MAPLFGFTLNPVVWIAIAIVGVLVFGRRLPEVARSLGQSVTNFKHGMRGVEEDVTPGTPATPAPEAPKVPQRITTAAPKFETPAAAPADVTPKA